MNPTYRKIDTDFIKKDKDELTDEEWEKQKKINAKKRDEQMKGPEPPKSKSPSPPPDTGSAPPDKRVEHPDDEPDEPITFQDDEDDYDDDYD